MKLGNGLINDEFHTGVSIALVPDLETDSVLFHIKVAQLYYSISLGEFIQ